MLAIAAAARDRSGGHPLWHLLIVAAGAVLVFVVIKAKELWDRHERPQRSRWSAPTVPILALALLSAASGAIHSAVSAEHFQEAFIYGAFFLAASTSQAAWAALLVYRPTRTLLIAGAVGNATTIILWTLTRTVGLPFGPQPWQPETIGTLDVTSTLLELAIVLGSAALLVRKATLTAPDTVTQRLETIRAQHPTFALEPGLRNPRARSGGEANGECVRGSEEAADDAGAGGLGVEAKVVQALEYCVEREAGFHAGKVNAETHVWPGSERDVRRGRAVNVEAVRLDVVPFVAVGRSEEHVESSTGRDVEAGELRVPDALARDQY